VQAWYALVWSMKGYQYMSEQLTAGGRPEFVMEGQKNTHVFEFGMVSGNASEKAIETATTKETKQVHSYVLAPKNGKPIRRWVVLFSTAKGELVKVVEVAEV
jgi:hypothetical protein